MPSLRSPVNSRSSVTLAANCPLNSGQQAAPEPFALPVGRDREPTYLREGLTGMSRPRPALGEALAATRAGDTLVITGLARLARSTADAHQL